MPERTHCATIDHRATVSKMASGRPVPQSIDQTSFAVLVPRLWWRSESSMWNASRETREFGDASIMFAKDGVLAPSLFDMFSDPRILDVAAQVADRRVVY